MIGPSLTHSFLALATQWALFLPLSFWLPDTPTLFATGSLAMGIWFGRELEQLWPHIGLKPLPYYLDETDYTRFIRQGCWPGVLCLGSALAWYLITS